MKTTLFTNAPVCLNPQSITSSLCSTTTLPHGNKLISPPSFILSVLTLLFLSCTGKHWNMHETHMYNVSVVPPFSRKLKPVFVWFNLFFVTWCLYCVFFLLSLFYTLFSKGLQCFISFKSQYKSWSSSGEKLDSSLQTPLPYAFGLCHFVPSSELLELCVMITTIMYKLAPPKKAISTALLLLLLSI